MTSLVGIEGDNVSDGDVGYGWTDGDHFPARLVSRNEPLAHIVNVAVENVNVRAAHSAIEHLHDDVILLFYSVDNDLVLFFF